MGIENLCLDVDRLFVAGFSNGASMTYNLSCSMTDTFAAFSGTGSSMNSAFYPENCGVEAADIKPFNLICGSQDGCASSQNSWFRSWKDRVDCRGEPRTNVISSTSTCQSYDTCGPLGNQPLEVCMIEGLAHCWSGNDCCDGPCLNQNNDNMDASAHILDWFSRVPRAKETKVPEKVASSLKHQLKHTNYTFEYVNVTSGVVT